MIAALQRAALTTENVNHCGTPTKAGPLQGRGGVCAGRQGCRILVLQVDWSPPKHLALYRPRAA